MRFTTATIVSTLAAYAAAYTQPDYSKGPEGNAIYTPGLNQQVPECAPFEITWDPSLGNKVSLVLLRGPSSNVVPFETIVEDIDNTGSYTWTPGSNLEVDTTHYGILLVVEGTGQYQWSTQFGIAKGVNCPSSSSSSAVVTSSATTSTTGPASTAGSSIVTVINDVTTTICPETQSQAVTVTSTATPSASATDAFTTVTPYTEITTTICPSSQAAAPTSAGVGATSVPFPPVNSISRIPKPSTLRSSVAVPTGTGAASVAPTATPFNGAGRNVASFGAILAGVIAFMAL